MKLFIGLLLFVLSYSSFASQSMTKTCSGRMRYCDQYGICTQEHYYLYAYQAVSVNRDGSFKSHKYRLKTRSILGDKDDYIPRDFVEGDYVVFDGPVFSLAIPWDGTLPIYYFQPDFGVPQWQELCP